MLGCSCSWQKVTPGPWAGQASLIPDAGSAVTKMLSAAVAHTQMLSNSLRGWLAVHSPVTGTALNLSFGEQGGTRRTAGHHFTARLGDSATREETTG